MRTVVRGDKVISLAESKGLNLARAFKTLGFEDYVCMSIVGGGIGAIIERNTRKEGIQGRYFRISGESRVNVALVHESRKDVFVINEPGPLMTESEAAGFLRIAGKALRAQDALVVSGSAPRGFTERHLGAIVERAEAAGMPIKADIAGVWLASLIERPLDVLKLNHEEFFVAFGIEAGDLDKVLDFKRRHRIRILIITEGSRGSTAFRGDGECHKVELHDVETEIAVGSGDSFFAGFLFGEATGMPFEESLRLASACGYANTLRYGAGVFDHKDILGVRDKVSVERIR